MDRFYLYAYNAWQYEEYFPCTVEIKIRDSEIYGYVSFELPTPETKITKSSGVIGIDTNASPLHLAIAEVSNDGNLVSYQKISLHDFLLYDKDRKEYEEWILAHKIKFSSRKEKSHETCQ